MTPEERIREALGQHTKKRVGYINVLCKVKSIDGLECVCTPQDGGADMVGVKLSPDSSTDGIVFYPAVDSFVMVSKVFNNSANTFISMTSEISSIKIDDGDNGFVLKPDKFLEELGKLQSKVDTISNTLKNWLVAPNDGGAALQAAYNAATSGEQDPDFTDVQTDKLKV